MANSKGNRSEHTATRLTKEERAAVERAAQRDNRTISDFVRLAALEKAERQRKRQPQTA